METTFAKSTTVDAAIIAWEYDKDLARRPELTTRDIYFLGFAAGRVSGLKVAKDTIERLT